MRNGSCRRADIVRATARISNGEGYAILVARTLPQIETLIARAKARKH
jgi:hypothetical protein